MIKKGEDLQHSVQRFGQTISQISDGRELEKKDMKQIRKSLKNSIKTITHAHISFGEMTQYLDEFQSKIDEKKESVQDKDLKGLVKDVEESLHDALPASLNKEKEDIARGLQHAEQIIEKDTDSAEQELLELMERLDQLVVAVKKLRSGQITEEQLEPLEEKTLALLGPLTQ